MRTGTNKRRKIAAFDLDSTLIKTSSGKKHAGHASDWKWWDSQVPSRLRELREKEGYHVVILSNQGGLTLHFEKNFKGPTSSAKKRVAEFKEKCSAILNNLDMPITIYAATGKDKYRKPCIGMWEEACEDNEIALEDVDLENSFFVGDAGGRIASLANGEAGVAAVAKDFSCSDRNLAHNIGIKFLTPEEFFRGQKARDFSRDFDLANYPYKLSEDTQSFEKHAKKEIVVFVGPPGAGKSTFYWKSLKPLGYERINQDILKSRDKCLAAAKEELKDGNSIAIGTLRLPVNRQFHESNFLDNTNADPDTRALWISLAKTHKVPARCVWFKTPIFLCEHNDAVRSRNHLMNPEKRQFLPKLAFAGFSSRFKAPRLEEGFEDITEIQFNFKGSEDEYKLWGKYYL